MAQQQEDRADDFDVGSTAPDETEAYFNGTLAAIDEALRIAPQEVRPHLEALRTGFEKIVDILAVNGWDFLGSLDELTEIFDNPNFEAAGTALDDYEESVCGIESDDSEEAVEDDPFSSPETLAAILGTDFGRQLFAEGMAEDGEISFDQALCLAENLETEFLLSLAFDGPEPVGDVVTALFEVLGDCGLDPGVFLNGG